MGNREVTQLLALASHYLFLARKSLRRVKDPFITSGQLAEKPIKYSADGVIDAENETFGHLASAAIRLATIAEKYEKNGRMDLGKNYRTLKEGPKTQETIDEVSKNLQEFIHFLYRDVVCHTEETDKEFAKKYAEVREKLRHIIRLNEAFDAVEKLHNKIEKELLREGIVIDC